MAYRNNNRKTLDKITCIVKSNFGSISALPVQYFLIQELRAEVG